MYIINENGPNRGGGDYRSAAAALSVCYQPEAMHFRGVAVLTNTQPRGAQRGPGTNQMPCVVEPIVDKAARELGIDRVVIRKINAPDNDGKIANSLKGTLGDITSSYLAEALDKGADTFGWDTYKNLSGKRNGSKVIGIGIGTAYHGAGNKGFDGLVRIMPDGKVNIHTGVGNLGTYSYAGCSRAAAEALNVAWDDCVLFSGSTERHLPWSVYQAGSATTFTATRSAWAGAMDAKTKLQEIAAKDLGGAPGDYELKDGTVVGNGKSMTFAQAAKRAIELGGKYDGHEAPDDINPITANAVKGLVGTGLVGVAKDKMAKNGTVAGLVTGFAAVEVDTETGKVEVLHYHAACEVGQVMHPQGLSQQALGGGVHGFGMALLERHVYDPKNGHSASVGMHNSKLPTYLDVALKADWSAPGIGDPDNPVGVKGVGEPAQGAGAAAILSAVSDALGGHLFNRTPIVPDMIVNYMAGQEHISTGPLALNTQ
jgi:CO/xanthine dehydrogenase Mo-binding subunit